MKLTLKVWRQKNSKDKGRFETYQVEANSHMSFLEMLDVLNEQLIAEKKEPVAFDHDCREGICGTCNMVINGRPHGPWRGTTVCQLHMREYKDGDIIVIEPFRAAAFPVLKDLSIDRSAFDRIIQAGGYISVNTGQAQDANAIPIEKDLARAPLFRAVARNRYTQGHSVRMHWLWRLRSSLSECLGDVVCFCKSGTFRTLAARSSRKKAPRASDGKTNGHRRIWDVLECNGLRSGMPKRDFGRKYCATQSRVFHFGDCF